MLSVGCKQYQSTPSWNTCEQYEYIYTLPENKNKPCIVEQIIYNDTKYYLIDEGNNDYDNKLSFPLVYSKTHFVTQDVWREMQLNKLL